MYKNQPQLAITFWEVDTLKHFIRYAGERLVPTIFVQYIHMLASLASGPECADAAFHFLKNSINKAVNWDHFFSVFEKYYLDFQEVLFERNETNILLESTCRI